MCEANAFFVQQDHEQLIMEAVDIAEPEEDGRWRLINIFGDQKIVNGRIKTMNLVNHKIIFEALPERREE